MSDDLQVGLDGASPSQDAKPFWQSRALIGSAVTIAALVAGFYKVKIDVGNFTEILVQVMGLIGAAIAIYGRIRATQPIKFIGGTVPGGKFNPDAEVEKALPVKRDRGHANLRALLVLVAIFAFIGGALSIGPVTMREVPTQAGGKPLQEWVQVVPVVDKRPFWHRLWSSVRVTPSVAVAYTDGTVTAKITKIELRGGAEF